MFVILANYTSNIWFDTDANMEESFISMLAYPNTKYYASLSLQIGRMCYIL